MSYALLAIVMPILHVAQPTVLVSAFLALCKVSFLTVVTSDECYVCYVDAQVLCAQIAH